MNMKSMTAIANDELWINLRAFEIDESGGFQERLAREQGWTSEYAGRVIDEYRRFLFLCCRAGHEVTPSTAVDEAWHLHLIYTRSYWVRLCAGVLPRPLHHDPGRGIPADESRFRDQYRRTLESYRHWFGEPPADIWRTTPVAAVPNSSIDESSRSRWARAAAIPAGCAVIGTLAGCSSGFSTLACVFIGFVLTAGIVVAVLAFSLLGQRRKPSSDQGAAVDSTSTGMHSAAMTGAMIGPSHHSQHHNQHHRGSCSGGAAGCGAPPTSQSAPASQPADSGYGDSGSTSGDSADSSCGSGGGSSCGGGGGCGGGGCGGGS